MIKEVLLDLDGVLANFAGGACEVFNKDPENLEKLDPLPEVLGIPKEVFWQEIDGQQDFYRDFVDPYPWAHELYNIFDSYAHVYICTAPSKNPNNASQKVRWLQTFFGDEWFRDYVITKHKHLLANPDTLLVDDRTNNVERFRRHGGHAVRFPQPWNEDWLGADYNKPEGWKNRWSLLQTLLSRESAEAANLLHHITNPESDGLPPEVSAHIYV